MSRKDGERWMASAWQPWAKGDKGDTAEYDHVMGWLANEGLGAVVQAYEALPDDEKTVSVLSESLEVRRGRPLPRRVRRAVPMERP